MERHAILNLMAVTVTVVFLLFSQSSISGNEPNAALTALTANEPNENEFFYPSSKDRVERLGKTIYENTDANIDLTNYEANLRKSLANGTIGRAWQNLDPNLTAEECRKLTTAKLAQVCFSTSLLTRHLLASSNRPVYVFAMLKIRYPCYGELFERDDLWKGVLDAYSLYAAALETKGDPNKVIDSIMGLNELPNVFQYNKMREQLNGKEIQFVRAQLEALKKIRSFIKDDKDDSTVSSTPFFSVTAPMSLVNHSLVFMEKVSKDKSKPAIDNICKLRLRKTPKMKEVKNYIDISIVEIERFLDSYMVERK